MRRTSWMRLFAGFLAIFLLWCGQSASAAAETTSDAASMIQLVAVEGNVTITDSSKKTVSRNENGPTRLYSGYHIITGEDSYAWISLDESKTVKLDAFSEAEIRSRRRKLEVLLISGELYCNVTAPLSSDQTYVIRTSDTITGIRGTSVGVDIGRTEKGKDTITLFKGAVDVLTGNELFGNSNLTRLIAGQLYSYGRASDDIPSTPSDLKEINEFFFDALKDDGIDIPWTKKSVDNDGNNDTNNGDNGVVPKEGKITNLFLDVADPTNGNDDSGFIDSGFEDDTDPYESEAPDQDHDLDPDPAQQESRFTVTWMNQDGTVLEKDENVPSGTTPSYDGDKPTKKPTAQYTYTFASWDKEILPVSGDATYTATYSETVNKYTITWIDGNGKTLKTDDVAYGATPAYVGDTPTMDATADTVYTFNGKWSPEIAPVSGEASYAAQFDSATRTYTITWIDGNGETLKTDDVAYGATPAYVGDMPTMDATAEKVYTFNGKWSPEIGTVSGEATYTAQFDSATRMYTITWIDGNGDTLITEQLAYGATPSYERDEPTKEPTKESTAEFSFSFNKEWLPEIVDVIEDVSYTAQFDSVTRTYTITWINGNGETLKTDDVAYGATPAYVGDTPVMESLDDSYAYSLSWTPEIKNVTSDAEYEAVYSKIGYSLLNDENGSVMHIGLYDESENEGNGNYSVLVPAGEVNEVGLLGYIRSFGDGSFNEKITDLQIVFDDIISPISMDYWFSGLPRNTTFENLDYLDTSHVTSMSRLFAFSEMTELDLSSFDTSSVTDMSGMFNECSNLGPTLDLSSFDTSSVKYVGNMFCNCSSLQTIYVGDTFDISQDQESEEMFSGCSSLTGGAGTTYSSTQGGSDSSYAHIDDEQNPGYFTRKPEP